MRIRRGMALVAAVLSGALVVAGCAPRDTGPTAPAGGEGETCTRNAVGLALLWVARQRWQPAMVAASAGVAVYLLYSTTETVPREFASYAPQLVTVLVLAVASQRLRPPAALGLEYRRGEGD